MSMHNPKSLRRRTAQATTQSTRSATPPPPSEPAVRQKAPKQPQTMPYLQAQVVHYKPRVSVLDKELTTVSYHGLLNFLLLLLSATLIRLAIENYLKYGILVTIPGASVSRLDWLATLAGLLAVVASFLAAFAIEKGAIPAATMRCAEPHIESKSLGVGVPPEEKFTIVMHLANLAFVLTAPACITYFAIFQPALGTLVMAFACIMFLKLYSLAATNFDLRRAYRLNDSHLDSDPLSFSSISRGRLVVCSTQFCQPEASGISALPNGCCLPTKTRASFSLNALALAKAPVGADDRIDAKADALPQPRPRQRSASTASQVLSRIADASGPISAAETVAAHSDSEAATAAPSMQTAARWSVGEQPSTVDDGAAARHKVARHRIQYSVAYPSNVTLCNFGYFWLAPTLCYQPSYPRTVGPIRKSFLAKRLAELVIIGIAMYVLIQQYAVPTLVGSVKAIDKRDGFWLSERVLKLSVISAIVWFLGFYAVFHAGLNALAEMLRFADRAFYLDWWNSVDLAAYWREWNLPIHYFCKRHIMLPLISAPLSLPVNVGVMLTFLVSAIMHELLFGIPTHCLRGYSFVGMMMQIPLIQLTQWLVRWRGPESGLGNAVFWISFCIVGQPLGVVQYYYTWVKNNP
ncbi:hypothetical protein H4R26_003707 [Coemansia thaxteri]|uniref:O-acyltransferase n=1 Tax=Coemansia thaxteri TaxID=2663907 RepID=A0A9W8BGA2_9FUNG|nr:hypothetical protein H4R26_003707 [Coemansia thaxteri]KAJ2476557.1 hypothetical protein EV174_004891 [Coemansia sp. RSA 2320]